MPSDSCVLGPGMTADIIGECSSVLEYVFVKLGGLLRDRNLPPANTTKEERQQHIEFIMAWYWTVLHYSRQAIGSALTDQAALQELVCLSPKTQASSATWTEGLAATGLTVGLVELLAHPPDIKQSGHRGGRWCMQTSDGTVHFTNWTVAGRRHWEQQDKYYSPTFVPATDAVIDLRCILLILKLVSIASCGEGHGQDPIRIDFMLRQTLQKTVNQINWCFHNVPASRLSEKGFSTANDEANTQQACQLASAIIRLMLPVIRFNLKGHFDTMTELFDVLQCLLQPQWGLPAAAAKAEFLKSGGMLLVLTALDKRRTAAIGAFVVLTLLLCNDSQPANFDPQICSSLLQMGVMERLSQRLHPMLGKEDSDKTRCLVQKAFSKAGWTLNPEDLSTTYPAWRDCRQYLKVSGVAALMRSILQSASKTEPQIVTASGSITAFKVQMPTWPISSKEWASVGVVVTRLAAVLDWTQTHIEPRAQGATPAVLDPTPTAHDEACSSKLMLMQTLLRLLNKLLTGHIPKLAAEDLLGAGHGLMHHVFSAYTLLKEEQVKEGPNSTIECSETLIIPLLQRCMQKYKDIDKDHIADTGHGAPSDWVLTATQTILSCLELKRATPVYASEAVERGSFKLFLPAFREAVQMGEPWTPELAVSMVQALQFCAPLVQTFVCEDVTKMTCLSIQLINKLPSCVGHLTFETIHPMLEGTIDTLLSLRLHLPEFGKDTHRSLIDLLKLCYQDSEKRRFTPENCDLQNFLLACLMEEAYLSDNLLLWQQEGYAYFGQHAFPLACQWVYAQIEQHQPDQGGMYSSFLALEHISPVYLTMLGRYRQMYSEEIPIHLVVQASCSLLTYLFRSLYGLTTTRHQAQNNRLVQQRSHVLNSQASELEQRFVHQIECLADFFEDVVAADAALVEGLKQRGPQAWSIENSDPHQLAQDLAYLTSSRALRTPTIRAVERAFALTQAKEESDWVTAGKQLVEEEQQAAATAAAKKAKKLRQNQAKQQAQPKQVSAQSPFQHGSRPGLPSLDNAAHECLLNISPLLALPSSALLPSSAASPLLDLFNSQRLSPLSDLPESPPQPSQAADTLIPACRKLGSTAGRAAARKIVVGKALPSSGLPNSSNKRDVSHQEMQRGLPLKS